jgi:hypothetical protein
MTIVMIGITGKVKFGLVLSLREPLLKRGFFLQSTVHGPQSTVKPGVKSLEFGV